MIEINISFSENELGTMDFEGTLRGHDATDDEKEIGERLH